DPVAIDKASLDLIAQYAGKSLAALSYPHIDPTVQLQHGQEIGLGSMDYELISLDAPTEP
ncbi:MAG: 4Fe-4S ferredoxin, partial [candidate division KSB1 bacterium]|nr:4Fe-4S ferredoxin [candidate division KSB1 bacterium]